MSDKSKTSIYRPQPGSISAGGGAGGETDAAILACLAELKLLTAANNDATALVMLITQMEEICEKLLSSNTLAEQTNTELMRLCEKMLAQTELLTCEPKTPLGVITYWNN